MIKIKDMIKNMEDSSRTRLEDPRVEFWGISLETPSEKGDQDAVYRYKTYFSDKADNCIKNIPLIEDLRSMDMVECGGLVTDTSTDNTRVDISINRRVNEQMDRLFTFLAESSDTKILFSENEETIRNLSGLKITEHPDYREAAFYKIGLSYKEKVVELIKWYFLSRFTGEDGLIDPDYEASYLETLATLPGFCLLVKYARMLLDEQKVRMHLCGLDTGADGYCKYKIYFRAQEALCDLAFFQGFMEEFPLSTMNALTEELSSRGLSCIGFALACTKDGKKSLNLYFR